jgi:hypothetical protein
MRLFFKFAHHFRGLGCSEDKGISKGSSIVDLKHRSWFKSTPFVLEITKYEYFDVETLAQSVPNGVQVTLNHRPLDERVGAALFDPRWQSLWA